MIGSNNTFIYTASLCERSSWRKSLTGVLETTDSAREKHSHIRRFVLLHCQYDHILLQELSLFTEKEMPFSFLCVRWMRAPPALSEGKAFQWFLLGWHKKNSPFLSNLL